MIGGYFITELKTKIAIIPRGCFKINKHKYVHINPFIAMHDFGRFYLALLVDRITVIGDEMK